MMIHVLTCLATVIYFEARSEPIAGQLAVAHVVMNRVASKYYPDEVCEVIKEGPTHKSGQPKRDMCQFSFWCDGKPEIINDYNAWQTALRVAEHMWGAKHHYIDISEGATHYHTIDVSPKWKYTMEQTVKIGRHIFYKPIGEGR